MKKKTKKEKIEVYFTEAWKNKIRNAAEQSGISMAEVIKRSLESYLK